MTQLGPGEPGLVSVVIPVYNGEAFLAEAIESVLSVGYRPLEVIAVDDGSTDSSPDIVERYPAVRLIRQANTGCTGARNRGLAETRGELIAFIDQDDRWTVGKLRHQLAALAARPDAGYSVGGVRHFLEPGCPMPAWMGTRGWVVDRTLTGYLPGTMLVRRETFDLVGVFDERFQIGSDAEWLIRARDAGVSVAVVDEVVLERRFHRDNQSGHPSGSSDMLPALAESLKRRRAAGSGP